MIDNKKVKEDLVRDVQTCIEEGIKDVHKWQQELGEIEIKEYDITHFVYSRLVEKLVKNENNPKFKVEREGKRTKINKEYWEGKPIKGRIDITIRNIDKRNIDKPKTGVIIEVKGMKKEQQNQVAWDIEKLLEELQSKIDYAHAFALWLEEENKNAPETRLQEEFYKTKKGKQEIERGKILNNLDKKPKCEEKLKKITIFYHDYKKNSNIPFKISVKGKKEVAGKEYPEILIEK